MPYGPTHYIGDTPGPVLLVCTNKTTGDAITTGVTFLLSKNGTTPVPVLSTPATHVGDGTWRYLPTSAELSTIGDATFIAVGPSLIPTSTTCIVRAKTSFQQMDEATVQVDVVDVGGNDQSTMNVGSLTNAEDYITQTITCVVAGASENIGQTRRVAAGSSADIIVLDAPLPQVIEDGDAFVIGPGYMP